VPDIARLMVEKRIHHIPIVRDRKVVGIVTRHDLLKVLSGEERKP
jgi:CBS domain-containing protein